MLSTSDFLANDISFGSNGLDLKLKKYLNFPNGVFIEAGANNGVTQSNTLIFEELFGWSGLLVEPSLKYLECRKNRSRAIIENCCLVADSSVQTVKGDFDGSLMASVSGQRLNRPAQVEVPAHTLTELLRKHQITHVDFVSLDVEGFELEVLKGLDFAYCSPTYFLIEVYEKDRLGLGQFLEARNYLLLENLSNYNHHDNPQWDGTHNDYLFKLQG